MSGKSRFEDRLLFKPKQPIEIVYLDMEEKVDFIPPFKFKDSSKYKRMRRDIVTGNIDIKGLDKAKLLCALYYGAKPLGYGMFHFVPGPLDIEEAKELLSKRTYFDYLKGRVMKVELGGDILDPSMYERDNGAGSANIAVMSVDGGV